MVILDAVANVAPYAFVLPFLWIGAAYLVATIRVRRTLPRRQVLSIVAQALWQTLFWPLWLILASNSARNMNELGWMLIWYVFFIIYPLLAVSNLKPTSKSIQLWQKIGFASPDDFLLLRPLPETQPISTLPEAASSKRRVSRSIIWLMFGVSLFATGLSFVGNSLQPCAWLDIATGRSGCVRMMALPHGDADEIALSSDGRFMAMSSWQEPLRLYNVEDGSVLRELPGQQINCGRSVSFSPDNRWLATISEAGEVSVTDVQTGAVIQALKTFTDTHGVWFSPDGKHLAVSLARAGLQLWRTDNWTLHWVIAAPIYSLSFSADGRWLAAETDNDRIGIWRMDDGAVYQTISGRNYQMSLSPDGKELATSSLFGTLIKVWDVDTGQLLRTIPNESSGNLIYSPDGRYLVTEESYAPVLSVIHQLSVRRVTDGQQVAALPAYISIGCVASTVQSDLFAYSDWKMVKIFRWRQY